MNKRNSDLAGLLGLLAALGRPTFTMPDANEATRRLTRHEFKPMPEEVREGYLAGLKELNDLDLNEIDSAFIVVQIREKAGEPCSGCGEIHGTAEGSDKDGVRSLVISCGQLDNLKDVLVTAIEAVEIRSMQADVSDLYPNHQKEVN